MPQAPAGPPLRPGGPPLGPGRARAPCWPATLSRGHALGRPAPARPRPRRPPRPRRAAPLWVV